MYPHKDISKTWYVLVNPVAGFARGLEDLPLITKLIRENEIPYELVFSQHKHHVTELTVQAVNDGLIPRSRIESYITMYNEVKDIKEWQLSKTKNA